MPTRTSHGRAPATASADDPTRWLIEDGDKFGQALAARAELDRTHDPVSRTPARETDEKLDRAFASDTPALGSRGVTAREIWAIDLALDRHLNSPGLAAELEDRGRVDDHDLGLDHSI